MSFDPQVRVMPTSEYFRIQAEQCLHLARRCLAPGVGDGLRALTSSYLSEAERLGSEASSTTATANPAQVRRVGLLEAAARFGFVLNRIEKTVLPSPRL